jgi:PAS domain S-box-containing protein
LNLRPKSSVYARIKALKAKGLGWMEIADQVRCSRQGLQGSRSDLRGGTAFLRPLGTWRTKSDIAQSPEWEPAALWMSLLNEEEDITMREAIAKRLRSLYVDIPALRPGTAGAYALALAAVCVATALRLAIDPYVEGAQFITFFPAIVITTLISGFGAGFLCAVLSTVAADFFVLSPRFSFVPESSADLMDLLLFGPLAAYLVIIIARMRSAIEREQAERWWRVSKNRLQLALDAALLGWWQYDPCRGVVSGDRRLKEIFNLSADETPIEEIMKRVHPHDAERVSVEREAALDSADPKPYATQYRVQQQDGAVRWLEVHGLPDFEGAGSERQDVSIVGTVQDVTERKQQEEREHLLMREISHRGKNMLSVVHSIAQQTATRNPEDFIHSFSERIQALSTNQDLLIRSEWKGVEIEDLARAQLAPFGDLIGSRIAVCGPTLRLNAASAQAVGLALHELTTNAGKYGALSKETGRLDVGWATEGEIFKMSWTEQGGPQVSPPQRRGFGTILIQEMAERSVDGKVDLEYAPSGVTWRLTCPAVNALEQRGSVASSRFESS